MSGAKEIRNKIKSIQNTQKITSAMEMVAASKMRKAQQRMEKARPYAQYIRRVVSHVGQSNSEYQHCYMEQRETVKKVAFIIVSSDKGLCGGLNINLFKETNKQISQYLKDGIDVDVCLIGKKAQSFFGRKGVYQSTKATMSVISSAGELGDAPDVSDLLGCIKVVLDAYTDNSIQRVFVIYNRFVNTMSQKPSVQQLLPIPSSAEDELKHHWDYIYEQEAKEILETLFTRFIESQVYQSVVENIACEQAARMVAMKSASDNAGDIIQQFQLIYNKARQAAITQELSEIVAGAAAVS